MADVKDMKRYYTIDMQVMLKFGLTISKWMLLELVHFRQAVADNGYCDDTRKELAEAINLKGSTVKNLVSQLVADGYLKRNSKNDIKTTPKWHKLQSLNGKDLDGIEGSFQNDGSNKRGHSKMTVGSFLNDGRGHSKMTTLPIYRENKERIEREEFSFKLKNNTHYSNLSQDYKDKLFAKCLLIDEAKNYNDFILALESNAKYKYVNFELVYRKWYSLLKDNDIEHKADFANINGDITSFKQIRYNSSKVYAINPKTLELIEGKVKTLDTDNSISPNLNDNGLEYINTNPNRLNGLMGELGNKIRA